MMNASQFMDKQIMDLTSSSSTAASQPLGSSPTHVSRGGGGGGGSAKDFIDLMNHPQDEDQRSTHYDSVMIGAGNGIKEEIVPSYDFQPIRPTTSSLDGGGSGSGAGRVWSSVDSKLNSASLSGTPVRNYGSLDLVEPVKVTLEKDRNAFDAAIVSEIDKTMKKHADNLLHVLDGVSARLTQLETRTRHLENSVDDVKVSVVNNFGSTDGKMRQLENILREVQTGVQVLKDKQEIMESQLQLAKLQVSKGDQQQSESQSTGNMDPVQQAASVPPPSHQQLPPVTFPQFTPPVNVPPSTLPPHVPQQNLPPPAPLPNQFPQSQMPSVPQRDPYYPPPVQTQEPPTPQYQAPLPHPASGAPPHPSPGASLQASAAPPHQPYPPPSQPQYSQPLQPPQPQPSLGHHPEETSYVPSQSYPPSLRQASSQPPSGHPPQQYYGTPAHMYEPPSSRSSSGFPTGSGYGPPSGPTEPYPYGGSPSQYGSSSVMKPQQLSSPAVPQSGGTGYPQLPTARVLPQALPTASAVGGGSGSPGSGNKVPLDDVIDKVTSMGFPREHVQATVRKLTENGQSVDLNVVLDKLMNDGDIQPQRGWFGR